jgi:hypothetical protein
VKWSAYQRLPGVVSVIDNAPKPRSIDAFIQFSAEGIRQTVQAGTYLNWVNNVMTWGLDADNTNLAYITEAKLASDAGRAPGIYKCPSDNFLSPVQKRASWTATATLIRTMATYRHRVRLPPTTRSHSPTERSSR